MNVHRFFGMLALPAATCQQRLIQRRLVSRLIRRESGQFAPEPLEARAMFSVSTSGTSDALVLAAAPESPLAMATAIAPRTFRITWSWNQNLTIPDFHPAADVLALDWFTGSELRLADEAGIGPSMLIRKVGRKSVSTITEFADAVEQESLEDGVMLQVRTSRGNSVILLKKN
jgi:hypothetical protein